MKRLLLAAVLLVVGFPCGAAFEEKSLHARAAGMGGAGAADGAGPEAWAENPAALATLDRPWVTLSHTRLLGQSDLPVGGAGMSFPLGRSAGAGVSLTQFGGPLYRERELSAAHAFRIAPHACVGLAATQYALQVGRYGRAAAWGVDAGVLGEPHPRVSLGMVVRGLNRPRLGGGETLPARSRAGMSVKWLRAAWLSAELARTGGEPFSLRLGVEVFPVPGFCLRAGGGSRPGRYALGLGALSSFGRVDYAYQTHPVLGDQHLVSLSFVAGRPRP